MNDLKTRNDARSKIPWVRGVAGQPFQAVMRAGMFVVTRSASRALDLALRSDDASECVAAGNG